MESRVRASGEQFSTLLEFMESHGDLAKPEPGPQGRLRVDRLWQELANTLNSVGGGVHKTTDKWKKVWADWKAKTKKKALAIQRHSVGTGGGPKTNVTLTPLEARVIGIIGAQAVKGHFGIEEQGFNFPSTSTSQNVPKLEIDSGDIASPHSSIATPRRRHVRARRRRAQTPFDRATSEFVAIEHRRLQLEERRAETEARRVEMDVERNELLGRFANIAEAFLQHYLNRDRDSDVATPSE